MLRHTYIAVTVRLKQSMRKVTPFWEHNKVTVVVCCFFVLLLLLPRLVDMQFNRSRKTGVVFGGSMNSGFSFDLRPSPAPTYAPIARTPESSDVNGNSYEPSPGSNQNKRVVTPRSNQWKANKKFLRKQKQQNYHTNIINNQPNYNHHAVNKDTIISACGRKILEAKELDCFELPSPIGLQCCCRSKRPTLSKKNPMPSTRRLAYSGNSLFSSDKHLDEAYLDSYHTWNESTHDRTDPSRNKTASRRYLSKDIEFVRCFPSVIIIGAQKSGTTVLLSYMLDHPEFIGPKMKELHFFDRAGEFKKDTAVSKYLNFFPPIPIDIAKKSIVGETTPSYILGRQTPDRIRTMLPKAKFILSLRNPIDRAWSEYQMEFRRIESQDEFLTDLQFALPKIRECIKQRVPNWKDALSTNNNQQSTCAKCDCNGCSYQGQCRDFVKFQPNQKACHQNGGTWCSCAPVVPEKCIPGDDDIKAACNTCHLAIQTIKGSITEALRMADCLDDAQEGKPVKSVSGPQSPFNIFNQKQQQSAAVLNIDASTIGDVRTALPVDQCLSKPGEIKGKQVPLVIESLAPVEQEFSIQMQLAQKCFRRDEMNRLSLITGEPNCWQQEVTSAIMFDHIFRSLYFPQVSNWLRAYPNDQLFVYTNEQFRQEPQVVLDRVHNFLGLQDHIYNLSSDDLARILDENYPKFEETSGWTMQGDYSDLPLSLRDDMISFFIEPIQRLEEYVGWATKCSSVQTWNMNIELEEYIPDECPIIGSIRRIH